MLNPRSIESALRSASSEVLLIDNTGERGSGRLALRIRPGREGADPRAEWLALWWRDSRKRTGVLGRYPTLSLRGARDRFSADWRPEIEAGRDPRRAKRIAALAGSVQDLLQGSIRRSLSPRWEASPAVKPRPCYGSLRARPHGRPGASSASASTR